jgi:hypothetical protein
MYHIFTSPAFTRATARATLLLLCLWFTEPATSQSLPCDAARLEAHATGSSCTGCAVKNPAYAVDDNMITASSLVLQPLASGAYVEQTLYFNTASGPGDSVHLYLSFADVVTDVNILKGIQLATYNAGTYNNDRAALAAPAFRIHFPAPEQAIVSWAPAQTFTKVEIRLITGQTTPLLKVNIHYANRGAAAPTVPSSEVKACSGGPAVLQASAAPGTNLQWYTAPSGGCPVYEGAEFKTPVLTDTVTYYVAAAKGACVTPQRTPLVVNVQPGVIKQWDKTYGGSQYDEYKVILPASDGRYFLAGTTLSKDGNVTSPTGGTRSWVMKVGPLGGILWNRTYTHVANPFPNPYFESVLSAMIPADNGTYMLAGVIYDKAGQPSRLGDAGYPWVAKIDSNGNKLWDKSFAIQTYNYHQLAGIVATGDGGFLLGGHVSTQSSEGWYQLFLIKIDANGNLQWEKTLGGSGEDRMKSLLPAGDGGYFVAGYTASNDGIISDGNNGGTDYFLMKITADGNKVWDKTFGSRGSDQLTCMQLASDGGVLLGGSIANLDDGDVGTGLKGGEDIWLLKTDANGNKLWDRIYGGSKNENLRTITPTGNGFLLGAVTTSADGDITDGNNGDNDWWIVRIDEQGNKVWDKTYGSRFQDQLYALLPVAGGGIYAAGATWWHDGDVTEPVNGDYDAWLVKLMDNNCNTTTGSSARMDTVQAFAAAASPFNAKSTSQQTVLTAYPNPFTRQLQLRFHVQKSARVSLELYDTQGKLITRLKDAVLQAGLYNETIDGSGFTSGTYICRLLLDGAMYSQTVVKL